MEHECEGQCEQNSAFSYFEAFQCVKFFHMTAKYILKKSIKLMSTLLGWWYSTQNVSLVITMAFATQVASDVVVPNIIQGSNGAVVRTMISHFILPVAIITNNKSMKEFAVKHAKVGNFIILKLRGGSVTPDISNATRMEWPFWNCMSRWRQVFFPWKRSIERANDLFKKE